MGCFYAWLRMDLIFQKLDLSKSSHDYVEI